MHAHRTWRDIILIRIGDYSHDHATPCYVWYGMVITLSQAGLAGGRLLWQFRDSTAQQGRGQCATWHSSCCGSSGIRCYKNTISQG
eukprot:5955456-Pleurochrysis_carterae.AAC.15